MISCSFQGPNLAILFYFIFPSLLVLSSLIVLFVNGQVQDPSKQFTSILVNKWKLFSVCNSVGVKKIHNIHGFGSPPPHTHTWLAVLGSCICSADIPPLFVCFVVTYPLSTFMIWLFIVTFIETYSNVLTPLLSQIRAK